MGSAQHPDTDPPNLNEADEEILDVLQEGRATKGLLVDRSSFTRNTIYNRLQVLEMAGYVTLIHEGTRLYELTEDPRGGA